MREGLVLRQKGISAVFRQANLTHYLVFQGN